MSLSSLQAATSTVVAPNKKFRPTRSQARRFVGLIKKGTDSFVIYSGLNGHHRRQFVHFLATHPQLYRRQIDPLIIDDMREMDTPHLQYCLDAQLRKRQLLTR